MEFKLKWLDSESFDNLPYKKAPTALGLADKNTGTVYIRDTGNVALDTFSVYHELEHLKGNDHGEYESPDEKGIYYKDTGQWLQTASPIANFIPGIGQLVSMGMAGAGGAMHNRSQQKSQMGSQQSGDPMSQFGSPQAQQAPNTIQVGGGMGQGTTGSGGGSITDRIRQLLQSRMKGNYAGGPQ